MSQNYGETIRFYLVDVKDIVSTTTRSQFGENQLGQLANLILTTGCLLKPLLLKQTAPLRYEVLEGHFEYYAAVCANEKDIERTLSGMVSAFVVKPEIESTAVEQVKMLNKVTSEKTEVVSTSSNALENRINNLETRLENGLSRQSQDTKRLEEQLKQWRLEMPKRFEPLEALNTLEINQLILGLKSAGVSIKKSSEIAKKVVEERKHSLFTSLQDVIVRKVGITEKTMVRIVDAWAKLGLFP